jgi:phospholipid/cholesterol/gamma-HCH transport system ATP-binding protein
MNPVQPAGGVKVDDLIVLRAVSMRFRHQSVLREIDLVIRRGQTVCIIGESGCGKTVMLKLIIGLLQPTQGKVEFDGRNVGGLGGKDLVKMRLRFGFLFQMAALFDSLTVFDNVAFGLREHHFCGEDEIRRIVGERLQEVGLAGGIEQKKPAELSGGQRKRVGLARALAIGPEVMLYDEPTTGLDPIMSDVINELILQTQRTKKTTGVVVTHDMKTVTKVADRVVMLYPLPRLGPRESQILYDGPRASSRAPTRGSASSSAARPASASARWPCSRPGRRPMPSKIAPDRDCEVDYE